MVVDTCLPSQMIFHDIQLLTSSNPRVKYFQSSWNMSISVEKHTGSHITKLNILSEEDVKVLRSDNGG